jgi:hypothetical protein
LTGKTLADLPCQDHLSGFATPQRFTAQQSHEKCGRAGKLNIKVRTKKEL